MEKATTKEFKLYLVGDSGVGKTTYVQRFSTGVFNGKYVSTLGAEITALEFFTNRQGCVRFFVTDVGGCAGPRSLSLSERAHDKHNSDGSCAIIMFDFTSRVTYKNIPSWHLGLTRVCGENMPIVVTGNKIEIKDRKVKHKSVTYPGKKKLPYNEMSVKANYNTEKPFLWLARKLMGDDELEFLDWEFFTTRLLAYEINRSSPKKDDNLSKDALAVCLEHWYGLKTTDEKIPPPTDLPPRVVRNWLDALFQPDRPCELDCKLLGDKEMHFVEVSVPPAEKRLLLAAGKPFCPYDL